MKLRAAIRVSILCLTTLPLLAQDHRSLTSVSITPASIVNGATQQITADYSFTPPPPNQSAGAGCVSTQPDVQPCGTLSVQSTESSGSIQMSVFFVQNPTTETYTWSDGFNPQNATLGITPMVLGLSAPAQVQTTSGGATFSATVSLG